MSHEDIISTAKVLKELIKEFEVLKIKGGIIDGKLVDADTVNKLASLPSREILISQFMFNLASPIYTLVNVLNNLPKKLVMTLAAIQKEKEKVNSWNLKGLESMHLKAWSLNEYFNKANKY